MTSKAMSMTDFLSIVAMVVASILVIIAAILAYSQPAQAQALDPFIEYRYCGPPARTESGEIVRRSAVRTAFRHVHLCPSTQQRSGACPGWSIDHVWPLVEGGCDAVINLQWLPNAIKSCALSTGVPCKDRWERQVYGPTNLP